MMTDIRHIVNIGCSFAYGNQADTIGHLSGVHKNTATYLSNWLGMEEINLARPGNSNEGILDNLLQWIGTTDLDSRKQSIILIGWTSGLRFGFVSDVTQYSNKERSAKGKSMEASIAFTLGPENPYRFKIDKWNGRWIDQYINMQETAVLSLYRNIIAAQSVANRYDVRMIHYHSLDPKWNTKDGLIYPPNRDLRTLIDEKNFYAFEQLSLQQLANSDSKKYHVAHDDSHPNHSCYEVWARDLLDWIKNTNQL